MKTRAEMLDIHRNMEDETKLDAMQKFVMRHQEAGATLAVVAEGIHGDEKHKLIFGGLVLVISRLCDDMEQQEKHIQDLHEKVNNLAALVADA